MDMDYIIKTLEDVNKEYPSCTLLSVSYVENVKNNYKY